MTSEDKWISDLDARVAAIEEKPVTVETEAWTCDCCELFVYSIDKDRRPVPDAPTSYFGGEYRGKRYEKICTLCFEMKQVLMDRPTDYWRVIQTKIDTLHNQRMQKLKEQGGGNGAL